MIDTLTEFERVMDMAFKSGMGSIPARADLDSVLQDSKVRRRFQSACHRGFDRAQSRIVDLIASIRESQRASSEEKLHSELLLRKVADGIAYNLLDGKQHWIRRLAIAERPPYTELSVIRSASEEAARLNHESRLTFALLADLTTFIHVADLLRVDLRGGRRVLRLIELKSGRVNSMLMDRLDAYEPEPDSLELLRDDSDIGDRHRKQAERIMKQRIRSSQLETILSTDAGVDPVSGFPFTFSDDEFVGDGYDELLDQLCTDSRTGRPTAAVVQDTVYVAVAHNTDPEVARREAAAALFQAHRESIGSAAKGLADVREELGGQVEAEDCYLATDVFRANVYGCPTRPFTQWRLSRENIMGLASETLAVAVLFDLAGLIWIGRKAGLTITMSSKRFGGRASHQLGRSRLKTWGGRVPQLIGPDGSRILVGGGIAQRCLTDLAIPLPYLTILAAQLDAPLRAV